MQSKLGFLKKNLAWMSNVPFASATGTSPDQPKKPGLVERGSPCSVREPVWDRRESFWCRRLRLGHAAIGCQSCKRPRGRMPVGVLRDRVPLRRRATLRVEIRTSNDCAHSPEWSRDPSADRNSGALDLVILDDRATPASGVAPRPSKKCRLTRHGECLAPVAGDGENRRITLANVTDGGKRQEAIARLPQGRVSVVDIVNGSSTDT